MSKNLRTFIAVKIKPESELIHFVNECRKFFEGETIKWVDENNLHLTLKFLGKISENQVAEIKNLLVGISRHSFKFSIDLNGTGYFKSKGSPRVLFVGISDFEPLQTISGELNAKLFDLGFEKETKAFKPHLTIGRIKYLGNKKRFYEFITRYKDKSFQKVLVSEIIFYQSILKPQGPEYIPLQVSQLNIQ